MNFETYTQKGLFLIAGPCVVESKEVCLEIALHLKNLKQELNIPIIFKASFRKANRTSHLSFSGMGDEQALQILKEIKEETGLPILTDVHEVQDIEKVKGIVDVIQIPAFLCRQTDLIQTAAATGLVVNIKKGQFASADIMHHAVEKARAMNNHQIMLTERGSFFGYEDLIVDMRNISWMKEAQVPVVYDGTHSVQQPNKAGGKSGGVREMIAPLVYAAVAAGAGGLFLEVHPNPEDGLSDATTMLPLDSLKGILEKALAIYETVRGN